MYTLLLIEDDQEIQEIINDYFSKRDYRVLICDNGDDCSDLLMKNHIDVILLDIMLPREDGFSICKKIRKDYSCPIIFLTARVSEKDKLSGYALGADDYVTKPFSLPVLDAKIKAILARSQGNDNTFEKGPIRIDRITREVFCQDRECHLAPREYDILLFLMENEGRIYSREHLLIRFWGYDFDGNERVVDNHIRKRRKALGNESFLIKTYNKLGWSFASKNDHE